MGEIWLDLSDIGDCSLPEGSSGDPYLNGTDVGSFGPLAATGNVLVDTVIVGSYTATYIPPPTLQDPRYRTRVFLNAYIQNTTLTKDDDNTEVVWASMYAYPDYPVKLEFYAASNPVDLLFVIGYPTSTPLVAHARYDQSVPITIWCIDKDGITGAKLQWKAERELRRIFDALPHGSFRSLELMEENTERLGSTTLYSVKLMLTYRTTAVGAMA